jgi:hypothetical protein
MASPMWRTRLERRTRARRLVARAVDGVSAPSWLRIPLQSVARRSRLGLVFGLLNSPHALASLYGGTDKGWHGYMQLYRRHVGRVRLRANVVLEIGIGGYKFDTGGAGGSLCVWRDYMPRSLIVGIDVHPKDVRLGRRVRVFRADQGNTDDLSRVIDAVGVPNVVIDDGSHRGSDVQTTFEYLFPRMPEGSIYVIEDLHTSYWPMFGGGVPAPATSAIGLIRALALIVHEFVGEIGR